MARFAHDSAGAGRNWKELWRAGGVWVLAVLLGSTGSLFGATYYAAINGSTANTGLSTNSPWPLQYALAVGPSNNVIVMPGTWSGTQIDVYYAGTVLQSQVKWGARFLNSPVLGVSSHYNYTTIDGFEIAYSGDAGVYLSASNDVVRNCWIHHCGTNSGVTASGISANHDNANQDCYLRDMLFENNLVEYNGAAEGTNKNHGMYLNGTNIVVRNNVCRYNVAAGIQIWDNHGLGSTNVQIYNNLCYGNGHWALVAGSATGAVYVTVFGNTLLSSNSAISIGSGVQTTLACTNNILIGNYRVLDEWLGAYTVSADYNLMNSVDNLPLGLHGLLTNYPGFVNPAGGLYWLATSSPARGGALSGCCGPVGFFDTTESSVMDLGAFQYSDTLANDTRILDPSSATGADYWSVLFRPPPPLNLRVVNSSQ